MVPGPPDEPAAPPDDLDPLGRQPGRDVRRLRLGQRLHPPVEPGRVDPSSRPVGRAAVRDPDAEAGRGVQQAHRFRGGDERLGRHAVGQHAGATEPVGVHDGDLRPELGGHQGGLIAARATTENHDACMRLPHST